MSTFVKADRRSYSVERPRSFNVQTVIYSLPQTKYMQRSLKMFDPAGAWPWFATLLVIAALAFWPSYFAPGLRSSSPYIHLHAATATVWVLMLIAQPWLIRTYRYDLHRRIGTVSYVIAPIVVVSMLLLANHRLRTVPPEAYQVQTYILYLQVSLAFLFALSYTLAIVFRKDADVHARFMVCTGLTLIDPVFARLFYWIHPDSVLIHQWFTYGLTDLLFLMLIVFERRNGRGRWVFPIMLFAFILTQIPALLMLTWLPTWQAFATWFAGLPIT